MNRRSFVQLAAAATAGAVWDVERLLWVPGRKSYFEIVRPVRPLRPWETAEWFEAFPPAAVQAGVADWARLTAAVD
jgi:hypothetical protein